MKRAVRAFAAFAMCAVGALHFIQPEPFVSIVPAALPAPLALVYLSGFFEILGGIGLMIPRVQKYAAYGLIALYVAVFPANINMAVNHIHPEVPAWAAWGRLPFQFLFIALAWWLRKP